MTIFILVQDLNTNKEYEFGVSLRKDAPMVEIKAYIAKHYPHLHVISRA